MIFIFCHFWSSPVKPTIHSLLLLCFFFFLSLFSLFILFSSLINAHPITHFSLSVPSLFLFHYKILILVILPITFAFLLTFYIFYQKCQQSLKHFKTLSKYHLWCLTNRNIYFMLLLLLSYSNKFYFLSQYYLSHHLFFKNQNYSWNY